MKHRLSVLFTRARRILRTEGLTALIGRGFGFLAHYIFRYETYYVTERSLENQIVNKDDFIPNVANLTFKVITSNKEADELVADGFEDFRSYQINAQQGLNKGAIAFCLFVGTEVGYLTWIARSRDSMKIFNDMHYRVDFANSEACSLGAMTVPKHRRKGLKTYGYLLREDAAREMGIVTIRGIVATDNIANLRANARLGVRATARARYLKFLWLKWWQETPMDTSLQDIVIGKTD